VKIGELKDMLYLWYFYCTSLLMWIKFGVGNMDKIGFSSCELY